VHLIKAFPLIEVKAVNEEQGIFEGLCSTYGGDPDLQGDVVDRGAFDVALKQGGPKRPLLYSHQSADIIGEVTLSDTSRGLKATGKLVLEVARAREVYALLRAKILGSMSIGYQVLKSEMRGDVRHLTALKLHEISLTAFPANPLAQVEAVKTLERQNEQQIKTALADCLREVRKQRW